MDILNLYKQQLKQAISIKSISTDPNYLSEIKNMVEWLNQKLSNIGFEVKVINGYDNPIILASLIIDPSFKTVLHYGHYDVQPAEIEEGWNSEPFELTEKDSRLVGRGVVDNKGQFLIYFLAIEKLKAEGKLGYNVKFILEGNEETGSKLLPKFMADHKDELSCDFVLASDGEILNNQPTIDTTYRGTINSTLTIYGPKTDLHSGLYGGTVVNPIHILNKFLTELSNENGKLNFDLDGAIKPNNYDESKLKNNPLDYHEFTEITGFDTPVQNDSYQYYKTLGFENIVIVTGIKGGYLKDGYRNAVASVASAKINLRFNPGLNPDNVANAFREFTKQHLGNVVKYDLSIDDLAPGVKMDISSEYAKKAEKILSKIHNKEVFYNFCGATLPIAHEFVNLLKVPTILTGLGNADCNMHAANENYKIDVAEKGLQFVYEFLKKDEL